MLDKEVLTTELKIFDAQHGFCVALICGDKLKSWVLLMRQLKRSRAGASRNYLRTEPHIHYQKIHQKLKIKYSPLLVRPYP